MPTKKEIHFTIRDAIAARIERAARLMLLGEDQKCSAELLAILNHISTEKEVA